LAAAFKVEASIPPAPTTDGESKPVSWAICKLLYTFCKIRGDTVIIQFLNSETRLIEFLLSAFEEGNPSLEKLHSGDNGSAPDGDNSAVDPGISSPDASTVGPFWEWEWEQRYITLLWLSLLIRAPFDLRDISSRGTNGDIRVSGLEWPLDIPPVATRIVSLATHYLICAGKERDAAKILLVRMAVRKDMLAGFEALVDWVLASLQTTSNQATPSFYIGILSFLASALASCEGEFPRYQNVKLIYQDTAPEHLKLLQEIRNSDLGRKLEVKIRRNLCLKAFLNPHSDSFEDDVVDTINYLFDALLDRSTKVRLASSKALSICTLKMPPPMAEDVIDQIVNDLNADNYKVGGQLTRAFQLHGLTLTLSHLLYRQSPGCGKLSLIVSALLRSLAFEERSSSGQSIGTNVRDAACFGIWAIARKYKTEDLSEIQVDRAIDPVYGWEQHQGLSIIQILATELVVSACLDPERNIRRGASAALQELVGRHQNRVDRGLELSEAVNFQDVAWRSKAVLEVALTATKLSSLYGRALLHGIFGWRGVGDPDPAARRETAVAFGKIFWEMRYERDRSSPLVGPKISLDRYLKTTKQLRERLGQLAKREVEDRHGLQLCLASVVGVLGHWLSEQDGLQEFDKCYLLPAFHHVIEVVYDLVVSTLEDAVKTNYRIPHLIAESTCRIIEASSPLLWAHALQVEKINGNVSAGIDPTSFNNLFRSATSGLHVAPLSSDSTYSTSILTAPAISSDEIKLAEIEHDALVSQNSAFLSLAILLISKWICLQENEVAKAASSAAERLFVFLSSHERQAFVDQWIEIISQRTDNNVRDRGVLSALLLVYPNLSSIEYQGIIIKAINKRWANYHRREKRNHGHFEARIIVLECLRNSCFSSSMEFSRIIVDGLDDYTIFERKGDVGMGVRLEAVKAVGTIWEGENHIALWSVDKGFNYFVVLVGKILRLSCEKADKVRSEAQQALAHLEKYLGCEEFPPDSKMNKQTGKMEGPFAQLCTDLSSRKSLTKYFLYLLNIKPIGELSSKLGDQVEETIRDWRIQLIEGIVTSAGTGSGNLLPASRDALVQFCESDKEQAELVCQTLIQILATNGGLSNKENDRLNMSTLEVIAFLFDVMIMQESGE
jgi:hypothetical protein